MWFYWLEFSINVWRELFFLIGSKFFVIESMKVG